MIQEADYNKRHVLAGQNLFLCFPVVILQFNSVNQQNVF